MSRVKRGSEEKEKEKEKKEVIKLSREKSVVFE